MHLFKYICCTFRYVISLSCAPTCKNSLNRYKCLSSTYALQQLRCARIPVPLCLHHLVFAQRQQQQAKHSSMPQVLCRPQHSHAPPQRRNVWTHVTGAAGSDESSQAQCERFRTITHTHAIVN